MSHKKYDKGYGIIYHGRSSLSVIRYCPYCGIDLQESGRDIRQEVLDEIDADKGG
jgi:hypothetical protein